MKNKRYKNMWMAAICLVAAITSAALASAALEVDASLDRKTMGTDGQAILTVTVEGARQARVELPEVDGLRFQLVGNSSNMRVVNGQVSVTLEKRIAVRASEPGSYDIPPVRVQTDGGEALSDASLSLSVSKGSGKQSGQGFGRAAPAPSMPNVVPGQLGTVSGTANDLAFLEVVPAKTDLVVGEFVPVEIRAYFRAGERISLRSLPKMGGGAFVLKNQEGKPGQKTVEKNGEPYTMLTFYAGLSAVKPGEFPLEVSLDATVMVREKGGANPLHSLRSRMGSMFDDPFFGGGMLDDFFSRLVEKEVALKTDPIPVAVAELPRQGKPAGFSGAVGKFTAISSAMQNEVKTGDPVTVEVAVTGEGNFSRVSMPKLVDSKGWKVYPPSHDFAAADAIGQAGAKVFKQTVVPLSPDITEIPPFELSYYNPESKAYETARSEAIPLSVSGAAVSAESLAPQGTAAAAAGGAANQARPEAESQVVDLAPTPLYARPWFLVLQGLALIAILAAVARWVYRRIASNPERMASRSLQRTLRQASAEMDRAIAKNDVAAFFESLRHSLQSYVGRSLGLEPAAVTAADVRDGEIRELLDTADRVAFSGQTVAPEELESWKERALRIMAGPSPVTAK